MLLLGVCIDDKLSLQIFSRHVPPFALAESMPGRVLEACGQADAAYRAVGLEPHPKKVIRRAPDFKVWGAQFQGDEAVVSMDCTRLAALCVVTGSVGLGKCRERILQKLLGLWAFSFQCRRPLFSIFDTACKVGHAEGLPDVPSGCR